MRDLERLLKSVNLLNIALVTAIFLLAYHSFYPGLNMNDKQNLIPDQNILIEEEPKPEEYNVPSVSEFTMIAEQNLFHPERKIPDEKISAASVPPPEILLYGTLITDKEQVAYVEDKKSPHTTAGRGKRQSVLRIGNNIGGFTLTNIETEKIELIKGEERMIVYLIDPGKPKTRGVPMKVSESSASNEREPKQDQATSAPQPAGAAAVKRTSWRRR